MIFILITILVLILKFLSVGVVGLFFFEDLELTNSAPSLIYGIYFIVGATAFFSLLFFALGKRLFWLFIFLINSTIYITMYNKAPYIEEMHVKHDIKSRYFQDTSTFFNRMKDILDNFSTPKTEIPISPKTKKSIKKGNTTLKKHLKTISI